MTPAAAAASMRDVRVPPLRVRSARRRRCRRRGADSERSWWRHDIRDRLRFDRRQQSQAAAETHVDASRVARVSVVVAYVERRLPLRALRRAHLAQPARLCVGREPAEHRHRVCVHLVGRVPLVERLGEQGRLRRRPQAHPRPELPRRAATKSRLDVALCDQARGEATAAGDGNGERLEVVDDARAVAAAANADALLDGEQKDLEQQHWRAACLGPLDDAERRAADDLAKLRESHRVRAVAEMDQRVQMRLRAQTWQQPVAQRLELPQRIHLKLRAIGRHTHARGAVRNGGGGAALWVVEHKLELRQPVLLFRVRHERCRVGHI